MSEELDFVELQARLRADSEGAERRSLERELSTLRQSLQQQMDAGVSRPQLEALTALIDAIDAATAIIRASWRWYHKDTTKNLGWR